MVELTHEQKSFVVRCLARFMSPTEVSEAVKEEFDGLVLSRQNVRYYNPEQSLQLAEEWRELFLKERAEAITQIKEIGVAHKSVRLRELHGLYHRAKAMKNYKLAAELLEQAAKEAGGLFTNKRQLDLNPRESLAELLGVDVEELFKVNEDGAGDHSASEDHEEAE